MPTLKDTELSRLESKVLRYDAIKLCRLGRPRRWLAKYGSWPAEGHGPLTVRYKGLSREAGCLLVHPMARLMTHPVACSRTRSASSWPSHVFSLERCEQMTMPQKKQSITVVSLLVRCRA